MSTDKIKVAVRVRPFNRRGKDIGIIYTSSVMLTVAAENLETPDSLLFKLKALACPLTTRLYLIRIIIVP